jgi:hypothetical protein
MRATSRLGPKSSEPRKQIDYNPKALLPITLAFSRRLSSAGDGEASAHAS